MLTLNFDEAKEVKGNDIRFDNENEKIAWDYSVEVENMHVFPIDYDYGYLVFWGDSCEYRDTMVFAELQHLFDYLTVSKEKMEEAKAYAESKTKEYTIEYVAYALQTIHAKDDDEARKIANENLKKLNKDTEFTSAYEYRKSFDWDCCDIHYMVDKNDKYVIYN